MASALQSIANVITNQAIKGIRMGTVKYGPIAAVATEAFLDAAEAGREFKRKLAIDSVNPLSEDEYQLLEENKALEHRNIRLCFQSTRAKRETLEPTGIHNPIPLFAHWCLEIGGIYYELRRIKTDDTQSNSMKCKSKTILHQEPGDRNIKLEVSTDRSMHPSTKFLHVSTTILDDEKILWAASLIFQRFGSGYDLWIDNCQHFTQLLAEVISGRDNRDEVRRFFDKRSVMKLPVAASWLAAPVYGCTRALHHGLKPEGYEEPSEIYKRVGGFLEGMENFYLHPRVLDARRSIFQ